MADPHIVIATMRRRGLSRAAIARKLGLRDGETGYGITRFDVDMPTTIVVPGPRRADQQPATQAPAPIAAEATPAVVMTSNKAATFPEVQPRPAQPEITVQRIISAVSEAYGVSMGLIVGGPQDRTTCHARFAACLLFRRRLGLSGSKIARAVGRLDHTSGRNAVARGEELLATDAAWRERYERAEAALAP